MTKDVKQTQFYEVKYNQCINNAALSCTHFRKKDELQSPHVAIVTIVYRIYTQFLSANCNKEDNLNVILHVSVRYILMLVPVMGSVLSTR